MRTLVIILGLSAILLALVMAGGEAVLNNQIAHATGALAGGIFSIPFRAAIDIPEAD